MSPEVNLKATSYTPEVDDCGRILIPKEIRRTLSIKEGTIMDILVDEAAGLVVFQKHMTVHDKAQELAAKAGKPCHEFFGCTLSVKGGIMQCSGDCNSAFIRHGKFKS